MTTNKGKEVGWDGMESGWHSLRALRLQAPQPAPHHLGYILGLDVAHLNVHLPKGQSLGSPVAELCHCAVILGCTLHHVCSTLRENLQLVPWTAMNPWTTGKPRTKEPPSLLSARMGAGPCSPKSSASLRDKRTQASGQVSGQSIETQTAPGTEALDFHPSSIEAEAADC